MNELMLKLRILLRAEMTLLRAEAQRRTNSVILVVVAVGCVFVALVFLNLGFFYTLTDASVDSRAAFILAAVNLVISIIPWMLSRQSKPSNEEAMVREIRDMAMNEVSKDVGEVSEDLASLGSSIKQVKSGLSSLGGGGLTAMSPLLSMAIDLLKKKK